MIRTQKSATIFLSAMTCAVLLLDPTVTLSRSPQNAPQFELVEDLRIVSNDRVPQMLLTTVNGMTILSDGSIVTGHQSEFFLRVFNPNGTLARTIGRQGQGPGEFQSMIRVGSVGDSIWVDDFRAMRLHLYSRTGQYLRSISYPPRAPRVGRGSAEPSVNNFIMGLLPNGRMLVTQQYRRAATEPGGLGLADSTLFLVQDSAYRTLTRVLRVGVYEKPVIRITTTGVNTTIGQPLQGLVDAAFAPGGRFVVASDASAFNGMPGQVMITDLSSNNVSSSRTVQLPTVRVSRTYADSFAKAMAERQQVGPPTPPGVTRREPTAAQLQEFEQLVRDKLYVPDFLPVNKQAVFGSDGSIWFNYKIDGASWTVLVGDKIAMRVRVPADLWVRAATREFVWGTKSDADGLPIILRYKVVPSR